MQKRIGLHECAGRWLALSINLAALPALFAGPALDHLEGMVAPEALVSEAAALSSDDNIDTDRDGIFDSIDPNPGVTNGKVVITPQASFGGADYTFTIHGSDRVASLQVSSALFDDFADGMDTAQIRDLTKKVYAHFQDVFDFVLFTSAQASGPPGLAYAGVYFGAQNDIQGIGQVIYDSSSFFGSGGKLQGAMHLSENDALRNGPSLHELCHRWGAFLDSIPSEFGGHWGWSSAGGQLGGWQPGSLESLGGNQYRARHPATGQFGAFGPFANGGNGLPYSDLELYVMGLIPETGLPSVQIANDFQWVTPSSGTFTASSITTVPMSTVIATDGPRIPDHTTSQKTFRAMHVIIVKAPLTDPEWASYDQDVELFSRTSSDGTGLFNFWEATGGRATIKMDELTSAVITATPTPTPTPTPPTPTPSPTATPTPPSTALANISTRLRVDTGDNVLIGGFIVTGSQPKKLIVRAIGPSSGVDGALANPQLEIFRGDTRIYSNDNWRDAANRQEIIDSTIPPNNDLEAAFLGSLDPGAYTAIVSGVNGGTGIGLVEAYDLDAAADSRLANIATRGFVRAGADVMIGGLIVRGESSSSQKVLIRAVGPSLSVGGKLADPALQLVNASGVVIAQNDDWRSHQEAEITATTVAPSNDLEPAIVTTLPPAPYTAIVSGFNNGTGVAVVEVYALQ